jgi:flavin-binding protein dodecin
MIFINYFIGGFVFMDIEKHLIITGTSNVSWKDAIVKTIAEASKTIDYISSVKILEQRASIDGDKISEYFVDLDLGFILDLNRKNG